MHSQVLNPDESDEYLTEEGCWILELSNDPQDPNVSVARARVEPGQTTKWHKVIGTEERYVLLAGQGSVEIGDLPPTAVGPGEIVRIPADVRQRIRNTGPDDLVFLCICSPRFRQSAYRNLE